MNYEKLLEGVTSLYNIPKQTMDELQGLFLKSLGLGAIVIFLAMAVNSIPEKELSSMLSTLIAGILYFGAFVLFIPFQIKIVRLALKQPVTKSDNLIESATSGAGLVMIYLMLGVLAFSAIVLLPYGLASALVIMSGAAVSNLLTAFKMLLLILGALTIFFAFTKNMGIVPATVSGKNIGFNEMFQKSKGHFMALSVLFFASILPIELVTQFIMYGLSGMTGIMDFVIFKYIVILIEAVVRTIGFLLQLYIMWTAVSLHLKTTKII